MFAVAGLGAGRVRLRLLVMRSIIMVVRFISIQPPPRHAHFPSQTLFSFAR